MRKQDTILHYDTISTKNSGEYAERIDPFNIFEQEAIVRDIEQLIQSLITKKHHTIVDFGCGGGWSLWFLRNYCENLIGIDVSQNLLDVAADFVEQKKIQPVELLKYDGHRLPFEDNSIDCIFAWDVVHHLENSTEALSEIHRVLSAGGVFIGIEPNIFNPLMTIYHARRRHERGAFITNRFKLNKKLKKQFAIVNLRSNNTVITYNNKFFRKLIQIINPIFTKVPLFKLFSLRFVFSAQKKQA